MRVISQDDVGVSRWDTMCAHALDAWFRHTSAFIHFALTLGEAGKNVSFAIQCEDGRIVALQPLVFLTVDGRKEFSMGGFYTPFTAFSADSTHEERMEAFKMVMEEIDSRAQKHDVVCTKMFVDPLTRPILTGQMKQVPFFNFGYEDVSIQTTIISLEETEQDIFGKIAKGHRSDIHFAEREKYQVDIFDSGSVTDDIWNEYKKIYFAAAGREIGTPLRWQKTLEHIRDGFAVLVMSRPGSDGYISGNVVQMYNHKAYYALSATLRDQKMRGMGASMQWKTIQYLKLRGYTHYELGWIMPDSASQKEKDISHFKSLFGGEIYPLFRGEKTYT